MKSQLQQLNQQVLIQQPPLPVQRQQLVVQRRVHQQQLVLQQQVLQRRRVRRQQRVHQQQVLQLQLRRRLNQFHRRHPLLLHQNQAVVVLLRLNQNHLLHLVPELQLQNHQAKQNFHILMMITKHIMRMV